MASGWFNYHFMWYGTEGLRLYKKRWKERSRRELKGKCRRGMKESLREMKRNDISFLSFTFLFSFLFHRFLRIQWNGPSFKQWEREKKLYRGNGTRASENRNPQRKKRTIFQCRTCNIVVVGRLSERRILEVLRDQERKGNLKKGNLNFHGSRKWERMWMRMRMERGNKIYLSPFLLFTIDNWIIFLRQIVFLFSSSKVSSRVKRELEKKKDVIVFASITGPPSLPYLLSSDKLSFLLLLTTIHSFFRISTVLAGHVSRATEREKFGKREEKDWRWWRGSVGTFNVGREKR